MDLQIVMGELYETEFGIFDHIRHGQNRPLSAVAFHPSQDVNENSGLKKVIQSYIHSNIQADYGLNLLEFMDLPIDVTQLLVQMSLEKKSQKEAIANQVIRETEQEFNK